jgi:DNA-binding winged helix-turn-helix (wHTH) protein/tetratricopeptide (TPR) repeat protein
VSVGIFQFGEFELDTERFELLRSGRSVKVERMPMELLILLVSKNGQLVTRAEIAGRLWPDDVFVDTEHGINSFIRKIRQALRDDSDQPRYLQTVTGKGYRFIAPIARMNGTHATGPAFSSSPPAESPPDKPSSTDLASTISDVVYADVAETSVDLSRPAKGIVGRKSRGRKGVRIAALATAAAVAIGLVTGVWVHRRRAQASIIPPQIRSIAVHRKAPVISELDTVVLADFDNSTSDPVFDDTLKQALAISLRQSPFLNLLSEEKVNTTLQLMTLLPNTQLTLAIAREVCQRAGGKAYIAGSIASIENEYVVGLKAVNCQSGDTLALEQAHAEGKEKVLDALDKVAVKVRSQLGESLSSIQKFDTPIDQATTSSFEALKAYSLGEKIESEKGQVEAMPFYRRAIELDPDFAAAYADLGAAYATLGERARSIQYFDKAFRLRNRATEPEKYGIEVLYYSAVTGEIEKGIEVGQLSAQSYPRDSWCHGMLGYDYALLGQLEKSQAETLESIRLDPGDIDGNVIQGYAFLNQLGQAKAAYLDVVKRRPDAADAHEMMYGVAFLEHDTKEMERQVNWAADKPDAADFLLSYQSDTEAFYGHLEKARELSRRAVESATVNNLKETAAGWQMNEALREAEFGNASRAHKESISALSMASTRDVQILAALVFARAGDSTRAQRLADEVQERFPKDSIIGHYWLPTVRASVEINRGHPDKAIEFLNKAAQYEMGDNSYFEFGIFLYPAYVRGQAYLLLHRDAEAAAEFQKFLAHPTMVANNPLFILAHLGLARAYTLQGNPERSRSAYQEFFGLWKDADSDIPILRDARLEYAKLQ